MTNHDGENQKTVDAVCATYFKACEHVFESGISLRNWTFDSVFMVIAAWLHDFYRTGTANTAQLITFFKEYAAPAVVGAVTFISVFSVNKNRNGDSDAAEKGAANNEGNRRI